MGRQLYWALFVCSFVCVFDLFGWPLVENDNGVRKVPGCNPDLVLSSPSPRPLLVLVTYLSEGQRHVHSNRLRGQPTARISQHCSLPLLVRCTLPLIFDAMFQPSLLHSRATVRSPTEFPPSSSSFLEHPYNPSLTLLIPSPYFPEDLNNT